MRHRFLTLLRRRFLTLLVVLLIALLLVMGLQGDRGYILISYGRYTLETSLFILLVLLTALILFCKFLAAVLGWLNPHNWRRSKRSAE